MNTKQLVTIVLLLFVAGSVAFMILRETSSNPPQSQQTEQASEPSSPSQQIIVYYFHGDMRCVTCRKLESYAREVVQVNFADELAAGTVVWKPVNTDKSENTHFIKEYNLVTKAIIISNQINGNQVAFKNLDKIWDLVKDKDAYTQYIQQNLSAFIKEDHS